MPADLTPKAIDALVKRLRDWDITDDDKFLIADALTALEARVERLTGAMQQHAYVQGIRNSADTVRSMRATEGVLHQRTLDLVATTLDDIAARCALPLDAPAPAVDTLRAQIEALHREACRSLAASPDSAFYQGLECGLQRAMMVARGVGDAPAVDPVAEAAADVWNAAALMLESGMPAEVVADMARKNARRLAQETSHE